MDICKGKIEIMPTGDFVFRPANMNVCKKILKKLNPIRGQYWLRHIPPEIEVTEVKKKHRS